ncbi:MAG: ROK family protein [Candidatus Rokubacteria bacterium]|nr:ROK family protein [Candidatus Rokubacteria bacterium]
MSEALLLGVDVGGTTIAGGLVTADGEVVCARRAPARQDTALPAIRAMIATLADEARARGRPLAGVGVGVPGPVDTAAGVVSAPVPHATDLAGLPLAALLREDAGVAVFVDNDVNALALAEWRFGAGRGARSLVVLAPGTGFGAGVILDGRLVRGVAGYGGEFGHTPVKFDGRACWCGGRGCLAVYASGRGIADAARARATPGSRLLAAAGGDPLAITAPFVFREAAAGDPAASAVIDEACQALGAMIATIVNGLNPEAVIVTGGVAGAFASLETRVRKAAAGHAFDRALAATRVTIVPGDKRVSARGPAALVLYEMERREA